MALPQTSSIGHIPPATDLKTDSLKPFKRADDAEDVSQWDGVAKITVPDNIKTVVEGELKENKVDRVLSKCVSIHNQATAQSQTAAKNTAQAQTGNFLTTGQSAEKMLSVYEFTNDKNEGKIENDLEKMLSGYGAVSRNDPVDLVCAGADHFAPKAGKNVCIIVCIVAYNEKNEVMMVKKAEKDDDELWYLPYSRVIPNHTLKSSAQKSFEQQTGLRLEVTSMVSMESQGTSWYRFTLTGKVAPGNPKSKRDSHSICADWFTVDDILFDNVDIKAKDILQLVVMGVEYYKMPKMERVLPTIPVPNPHKTMLVRYVILHIDKDRKVNALKNIKTSHHLPLVQVGPKQDSLSTVIGLLTRQVYGSEKAVDPRRVGVISVEYSGDTPGISDGLCISLVYMLSPEDAGKKLLDDYRWQPIEDMALNYKILMCLKNKKFLPLLK